MEGWVEVVAWKEEDRRREIIGQLAIDWHKSFMQFVILIAARNRVSAPILQENRYEQKRWKVIKEIIETADDQKMIFIKNDGIQIVK